MTQLEYKEVIDAVCGRPKLYTPTGSFFEVISYVEGVGGWLEKRNSHSPTTPFCKWLGQRHGKEKGFPLDWHEFLQLFANDEEAIEQFQKLFDEFVQDC